MKNKWTCWILAIFLAISFSCNITNAAESGDGTQTKMEEIDRLSQEIMTLVEQQQIAHAKQKLADLGALFTHIGTEQEMSIEALELATQSIVQGKQALAKVTPDQQEIMWRMTQIRVLVDALTHPNQPIWKEYRGRYVEQVSQMLDAVKKKDQSTLRKTLQENYQLYTVLKPALALHQSPSALQMIDSMYQFVNQQAYTKETHWEDVHHSIIQWQELANPLFMGEDVMTTGKPVASQSPLITISLIGFILVTGLSYTGWKMYRGERSRSSV